MIMMIRKKRFIKLVFSLLIITLSVFLVEVISNFNLFFLDSTEKGIMEISEPPTTNDGYIENGTFYITGNNPSLKWNINKKYVHKFIFDYSSQSMLEGTIRISFINNFGQEEVKEFYEGNPIVLKQNIINVNERVSTIEFEITDNIGNTLEISNPRVDNSIKINKYRIIVVICIVLSIELLFFLRRIVSRKLEYAFLILSLLIGGSMLLCLPTNKVSWDEEVHFGRSYKLALMPDSEDLPHEISSFFIVSQYNWPAVQPGSIEEKEYLDEINNKFYVDSEKDTEIQGWTSGVYTPGYIFEALGIKIAKLFDTSFSTIVLSGRFASLISYIVLFFLSIKIIPIGKEILLFLTTMPTPIFLAITYNYDVVVYGFIMLGISIILNEWLTKNHRIDWKRLSISAVCLTIGCLPKAVYAPLVLLPLLIPMENFKNYKQGIILKSLFVSVFIALLSTFALPMLMGQATNDIRGGAVDSMKQLSLILSHPIEYTKILLKNIFDTFPSYVFGEATFRSMGHLGIAKFAYLVPITATMLIVTSPKEKNIETLTIKNRAYIFLLIAFTVALIWTSLYMAFTVPGSSIIMGVQGRYYLPFLLLFYLIISPNLYISIKKDTYRYILIFVCFIILSVTMLHIFISYCL